ncbi:MAG TPA: hypothetical protein VKH41_07640 [Myxococcota bacterium]|nr:hypothetical protein [Myxococcota bacterium]
MRIAALGAVALFALGCATRPPPAVASFTPLPGFEPNEEFVEQANRKLAIMAEGYGELTTGERFYYIAYLTREDLPDPEPRGHYPLWAETQTLWHKRSLALDPARYELAFIDARVFPGTPGSKTRRAVYESKGGHWSWEEIDSSVLEETERAGP